MDVPPSGEAERELASWSRRMVALLIDVVVLGLAIAIALFAAGMKADELRRRVENGETLLVIVLFLIPEAIYYTWMVGSRSQTFGKMVVGIKVVDVDSRAPIGYLRAFRRWVSTAAMRALFTIPTIVDHLWPLRDPKNQALHDKFARSVVVRT